MKKICVVTGSRAEYGLLYWLLKSIKNSPSLHLQLVVTGMHLSTEYGLTYRLIEEDDFTIDYKVEMLLSSDTLSGISKSTAVGLLGFTDCFNQLKPDIIVVLGDRFEIFAASIAGLFAKIPIAHIHGGESTEGAFDESIRHSITKMSWWHFVAADSYRNRVIQLGENPNRVFNVGGLGVDAIKKSKLLSKKDLINKTGIQFGEKNLLITYHPVTLEKETSQKYFQALLDVLDTLNDTYLIFTMPNADSDSRIIKQMIDRFVSKNKNRSISFTSLGHRNYISIMQYVDGVVGNSSSGLLEAPTFKIGTINIGDRQSGRLKAESIIDCDPNKESINNAISKLYSQKFKNVIKKTSNPYGKGNASEKIIKTLLNLKLPKELKKKFHDI